MATVARKFNVLIPAADGDTFTGPCYITGVKVVAGADAATVTLKEGSTLVYASGSVATGAGQFDGHLNLVIGNGATITVNITGTSPKIYIYAK